MKNYRFSALFGSLLILLALAFTPSCQPFELPAELAPDELKSFVQGEWQATGDSTAVTLFEATVTFSGDSLNWTTVKSAHPFLDKSEFDNKDFVVTDWDNRKDHSINIAMPNLGAPDIVLKVVNVNRIEFNAIVFDRVGEWVAASKKSPPDVSCDGVDQDCD